MNTPGHYIVNLAILGAALAPKSTVAITLGAILPDVPIFAFYFVAKVIQKLPESEIWSTAYYQPFWQTIISLSHSFPVGLFGLALCWYGGWKWGSIFFTSMILHSCFDIPIHHDDAHRHFYPLSDYRFISPVSYWDPKHHGAIIALLEIILVCLVTPFVWTLLKTHWAKAILLVLDGFYVIFYVRFYILGGNWLF
ncbi:hypothetical protein PN462_01445 [Spirulina sp. CS-785/01]|uniref:hypothetical protein n=1 Tax=Spirulina sp. CS-785/01 TaxID=3021716 RepID=UPI00232B8645|nr:hypothetical protein [Spirulina sp. CS-785/01]MDB9311748.1 hypothetical protein [Spirulina sp. CS-785/01]